MRPSGLLSGPWHVDVDLKSLNFQGVENQSLSKQPYTLKVLTLNSWEQRRPSGSPEPVYCHWVVAFRLASEVFRTAFHLLSRFMMESWGEGGKEIEISWNYRRKKWQTALRNVRYLLERTVSGEELQPTASFVKTLHPLDCRNPRFRICTVQHTHTHTQSRILTVWLKSEWRGEEGVL